MPLFTSSLGDVKLSFLKGCVCLDACTVKQGCASTSDAQFHTFLGDQMEAKHPALNTLSPKIHALQGRRVPLTCRACALSLLMSIPCKAD
eukprot:scaffold12584_cov24-Tisochrysis_lutea.AAC.1